MKEKNEARQREKAKTRSKSERKKSCKFKTISKPFFQSDYFFVASLISVLYGLKKQTSYEEKI